MKSLTGTAGPRLVDAFDRRIDYLRVSVTGRCNLKCIYCHPDKGCPGGRDEILSFEEIASVVAAFIEVGGRKVRLTGGEPLMRPGIDKLVSMLSALPGLEDLSLTTNGVLLSRCANKLKRAGLGRVNISLDTLKPYCFTRLTRAYSALEDVIAGIRSAVAVGFSPVKINVVVMKGLNDDEIPDFLAFGRSENVTVRFIEYMPIGDRDKWRRYFVPAEKIVESMGDMVESSSAAPLAGRGPARYYTLKGGGQAGIISPVSHGFCEHCNRLRLTSGGLLIPCLLSDGGISIREIHGGPRNTRAVKQAIRAAAGMKGRRGDFEKTTRVMRQVGG